MAEPQPIELLGRTRGELADALAAAGAPPALAARLFAAAYVRGATDPAAAGLSRPLAAQAAALVSIGRPGIAAEHVAADGTRKWLFRLADGAEVETVHIPTGERATLCVSSQVGCQVGCGFCRTATMGRVRDLTAGEILGQVLAARDRTGGWAGPRRPLNVVFMGMGEPLLNLDAVVRAIDVACDPAGLALSRRRITVSTSGIVPRIAELGERAGVMLAISLHAVTDELRDRLVPVNRRWPIAELLAACRTYPGLSNARRIVFEYVLLADVNDAPADARALVALLRGIPAKVNLIPFNPWPGSGFETSPPGAVERFAGILVEAGLTAPVRRPRGQDVLAACGQLRSDTQRRGRRAVAQAR
ncbi:MAG: 23S rRNA (adenine(2503)-C(2))-methyltransferase RlmN [Thermoleophilia bacterium]